MMIVTKTSRTVLSLGAGVQSSTLALMAAHGEITPMPEAAIFSDTMHEPASVYTWLDWLEKKLPFPVLRVSKGDLDKSATTVRISKDGNAYCKTGLPVFFNGGGGIASRQCTEDFKIVPIRRACRELVAEDLKVWRRSKSKAPLVSQWIGISLDEVTRMKASRDPWIVNRWPLIEKEMKRHDCIRWLEAHGYPRPPRSACRFCPYKSNHEWRLLRDSEPEEFAKAVDFERRLQSAYSRSRTCKALPFLHRSGVQLDKVDLSTDTDRGQMNFFQNDCLGMCGV